jgi:uncharacterized membrane protein YvbJ
MTNSCIECGAQLQDSWQHCMNCGTKVIKKSEVKQETVSPTPKLSAGSNSNKIAIYSVVGIVLIALVVIFTTKDNPKYNIQ